MHKWTDEQKYAINGRDGSLLVSAAAGSGKTTVLVERVIQRLTDTQKPCPADKLVIVTFTKAAAAQMKERIEAALTKRISQTGDPWLMKQQLLLQSAKICTIDSFCGDLVRENFHQLGISADYAIADKGELTRFEDTAVKKVLAAKYNSDSDVFRMLCDTVSSGGSDKPLESVIKSVYSSVSSFPFPEVELEKLVEPYRGKESVDKSVWGEYILAEAVERLEYCLALMQDAERILSDPYLREQDSDGKLDDLITSEIQLYCDMLAMARDGKWDELYYRLRYHVFTTFSTKRSFDQNAKNAIKTRRDKAKAMAVKLRDYVCVTSAEFERDRTDLLPLVECLVDCVITYGKELNALKMAEGKFDFGDIEHLALNLLVERDGDNIVKTPLAVSLSETYAEIMVDEYQDTNMLQDMLFSAVSDNEQNMFFVGDVKQSIYRFRQAMPEIFLGRRDGLPMFDGTNYPARINLSSNFRSRNGVTSAVNFVFSRLMSPRLGEVVYDESEQLNPKADYPPKDTPDVEFRLRADDDNETEAEHVAKYIKELIASGKLMKSGDGQRPIVPGDICILTRAKTRMLKYALALEEIGIPAVCVVEGELSGSAEVRVILSLLRVLDNPLLDIQLTAVMMSPVFGFTAQELARIRTGAKRGVPVYRSVVAAAESGDAKCRRFLDKMDSIRKISIGLGAAEFLRRLFDETDIVSIARALDEPDQRLANLWSLLDLAGSFDATGAAGLGAFLRFIDSAEQKGTEFSISEDSHAVRIMSIHKSKGLEFGVCILADLSASMIHPEKNSVVLSKTLGLGMLMRDKFSGKSLLTLPFVAGDFSSRMMDVSEETRVLYVAMTRAKEQLVIVATCNYEEKLRNVSTAFDENGKLLYGYAASSSNYIDWLLPIFAKHPDAGEFRKVDDISSLPASFKADFTLKALVCRPVSPQCTEESVEAEDEQVSLPDEKLMAVIKERMDYVYPYACLSGAVAKKQASGFADERFEEEHFASSRPAFMNSGGLTAAQKGTLTHKFLQLCDFTDADIPSQILRMMQEGKFTEQEAKELKVDEIKAFYESGICSRINSSPEVMREKKFAMLMPVREAYPDLPEIVSDETIVVQGMMDLAFVEDGEIVIVDYKTDRGVDEQTICQRHREQLSIYAKAMEKCTPYSIKEVYVYSLSLKKEIKVL
ncbi:MAG: helicase-exonuclease AddAB subunit AddA [Clostridia bacterium]|nr:helicase-exonuclease AddAB subunit AddA [Clostridia bacterium]